MGRRWWAWWRSGEGDRQERGLGSFGGASRSGSRASERVRRRGAAGGARAGGGIVVRGGGAEALPFAGSGLVVGRVAPLGRRQLGLGGIAWCRQVLGGGWEVPHPPWICRVGVWRRVRWMPRRRWQVVQVRWLLGVLSRTGLGLGGLFSVDVVAGRIRFLVGGGGRSQVVGGLVGLSAWWVVLPFHGLVLFVHGGLWPGGVGWWALVAVPQGNEGVAVAGATWSTVP